MAETAPGSAAPWDAARLGGVLTTALYEYFAGRPRFTLSAYGRDEQYEVLDGDPDDDVLVFERTADGARFEVEFCATVSPVTRPWPYDGPEGRARLTGSLCAEEPS